MRHLPYLAALCSAFLTFSNSAAASLTINIFAGELRTADGSGLAGQGVLLQLVNLGPNGVFDPISLADGDVSQFGQWVSGDDTLLNIPYMDGSNPGDFASAAAFDLAVGPDPTTGVLDRSLKFQTTDLPEGIKIGLRWFPGLLAANFATTTLSGSQKWGEFTRDGSAQFGGIKNGGVFWASPADGATVNFDALATTSMGGTDANSMGFANVPEPAAIGMSLVGAAGLAMLRRRRA